MGYNKKGAYLNTAKDLTKRVKLANGFDAILFLTEHDGFACVLGHIIDKSQYYGVCPDCGGMFCEACMTDGNFESHTYEDEGFEG